MDKNGLFDNAWIKDNEIIYTNGYVCKRTITDKNKSFKFTVYNSVIKSIHDKPLFQTRVLDIDKEIYNVIATNPTTAFRNTVTNLNIDLKGKLNGHFWVPYCRFP